MLSQFFPIHYYFDVCCCNWFGFTDLKYCNSVSDFEKCGKQIIPCRSSRGAFGWILLLLDKSILP